MRLDHALQADLSEVRGRSGAQCAVEIAAAGGPRVVLVSPGGYGKTMDAQAFETLAAAGHRIVQTHIRLGDVKTQIGCNTRIAGNGGDKPDQFVIVSAAPDLRGVPYPMPLHPIAFVCALAGTGAVVFWKGEWAKRIAFTVLATAFIVSQLLEQRSSWIVHQCPDLLVNLALLIVLSLVAVWSRRIGLAVLASLEAIDVLLYIPFWISPAKCFCAFYHACNVLGYLEEVALVSRALVGEHFRREASDVPAPRTGAPA